MCTFSELCPFGLVCERGGNVDLKLNVCPKLIANKYREGKVKSTPNRGVKKYLKPYAYKRSEHVYM